MKERDMIFATKEIMEQIQLYGDIEWKSRKNLYMALYQNLSNEFRIIGHASMKTLNKWGYQSFKDPTYIASQNTSIYFLRGLVKHRDFFFSEFNFL